MTNRERVQLARLIRGTCHHPDFTVGLAGVLFTSIEEEFHVYLATHTTERTRDAWLRFRDQIYRTVVYYARFPERRPREFAHSTTRDPSAALEAEVQEYKRQWQERGELLREALQEMERLEEEIKRLQELVQGVTARVLKKMPRVI